MGSLAYPSRVQFRIQVLGTCQRLASSLASMISTALITDTQVTPVVAITIRLMIVRAARMDPPRVEELQADLKQFLQKQAEFDDSPESGPGLVN